VSGQQVSGTVQVQVATDGKVPARAAEYAREKVGAVLHLAPGPVLSARVRMTRHGDPAVPHPVHAQVNLHVDGRLVRAEAAGESSHEAIDRLEARLRRRLERAGESWEDRRGRRPVTEPHEWRHESEVTHRHRWYPRPAEEREIVRHKSFTLRRCGVDDAALEMDLLDYEFHLFLEDGTGQDSVLYRAGPTGLRLAQLTPTDAGALAPYRLELTTSGQPAPSLTTAEAVERLNLLDLPFLFFRDADGGRGAVLYHRYDGHYGLLTPAG
jgi:ribosome-associated translation inhibitor RaiA